ncbi:hypothetical protein [Candidatus Magnetobacterium casense]|uniref:4Fe4S-binding SPASM domain-containing protein n=1 Tax=Candidatus Magnetobacterium casense TaxID=1455061 RepID=A0ABS6RUN4_9BACT|nr:hypothetical protein [Candidatus Magnetobacterium casensis]MBV6340334.1 hypothetical protein [Candidatus Magnetobacterium casensis]
MKDKGYTELICKPFCTFYTEGKESIQCGTYLYVRDRVPPERLSALVSAVEGGNTFLDDTFIKEAICRQCDFLEDGCDYRDGLNSPPCGGYRVVEALRQKGAF